jgi:hypothetical protein
MSALPADTALDLKHALLRAYPRQSELRRFADEQLSLNIEWIDGTNLQDKVHSLIEWADARGRLSELLDKAEADRPGNTLLAGAVKNARASLALAAATEWYSPPANPFNTCFVKGGRAFIDRTKLRASLQTLHAGDASTLVVTGERASGKSYSLRFVAHIADAYRYRVARINLREMGTGFGPGDLAEAIVREMGRSASIDRLPPQDSQVSRWTEELRSFVTTEIRDSGSTWWIVIDGVDPDVVPGDTLQLIKKLVLAAAELMYPMRVVLLDCIEPLPAEVDPYVEKEEIPAIEVGMLHDFFSELGRHRGAETDAEAIELAVAEVLRLAPDGPRQLRRLATAVERVARSLPG